MDKFHRYWFTDEIELHSSIALRSYESFELLATDPDQMQSRGVWYSLFSFLTHAAMVSKILRPIDDRAQERGAELRGYLEMPEDAPLLDRDARDNLEHIDERIDGWAARNESRIVEMVFDSREGYDYLLRQSGAVRRVLIANEMIFVSENRRGERIETALEPIHENLESLQYRCVQKLTTDSPYTVISRFPH